MHLRKQPLKMPTAPSRKIRSCNQIPVQLLSRRTSTCTFLNQNSQNDPWHKGSQYIYFVVVVVVVKSSQTLRPHGL